MSCTIQNLEQIGHPVGHCRNPVRKQARVPVFGLGSNPGAYPPCVILCRRRFGRHEQQTSLGAADLSLSGVTFETVASKEGCIY
jgi:hypothetical protein